MLFVPLSTNLKAWFIIIPFFSALADEGSGWLVRFVHPGFAYLKIASFLALEISLAVLIIVTLWAVFRGSQDSYRQQPPAHPPKDAPGIENIGLG
jgi:hypothetical protein